ncbi:phosphotransferase [Saccharibacillus alkalitolerans]|uniref:Phosphotransferase n=1 Tax=Saccharibacillus alkalitolerans TaxID=2705290 RepID=A0ABX0F335_9BACL|nr:phosphotransferase [Saccharibacillus alkalitolerans]NGZ74424.1 phosphotransferase [Saccharibacillus alkalitolerans]
MTEQAEESAGQSWTDAVRRYWPDYEGTPEAGAKGWNNTTRYAEYDGKRFVLRIYETHRDPEKIRFEHEVLLRLADAGLPFRTPVPLRTAGGETIVGLEDGSGRYACLFPYIEGVRPADEDQRPLPSFGEAAAELSAALAGIRTELSPAYRPYYELAEAYPLCRPERVADFALRPPAELTGAAEALRLLAEEYAEILSGLEYLRRLPHQLVHGDLNASNLLVGTDAPDRIEALLDFEFCTHDVRAMEAAVILSGLPDGEEAVRRFGAGFFGRTRLEPEEIEAVPLLMRLRKVDVFLHFLTRYWEGTDGAGVLEEQARLLSEDLCRMRGGEDALQGLLAEISG